MELGLSREELLSAFGLAIESSIQDVKLFKERGIRISLGEFPSEEKAVSEVLEKLRALDADELYFTFIMALLRVIEANNDRISTDFKSYLYDSPTDEDEII